MQITHYKNLLTCPDLEGGGGGINPSNTTSSVNFKLWFNWKMLCPVPVNINANKCYLHIHKYITWTISMYSLVFSQILIMSAADKVINYISLFIACKINSSQPLCAASNYLLCLCPSPTLISRFESKFVIIQSYMGVSVIEMYHTRLQGSNFESCVWWGSVIIHSYVYHVLYHELLYHVLYHVHFF